MIVSAPISAQRPAIDQPFPLPVEQSTFHPISQNCNFAIRVTEEFANRIVQRCQTQQGPVRDFVLGADVFGDQSTSTVTRLDFQPCETVARLHLEVRGDIDSRTVGVTPQAQIQSVGRHHFRLVKEIDFDGTQAHTRSPAVYVTPSQQHVGARTQFSAVPLLGQIADSIALQQAYLRNPEAARITADRITQQAAPEFNQRVDAELGRLNQLLAGNVRQRLEQFRLAPRSQQISTSDSDLQWCVVLDVPTPPPPLPVDAASGAAGIVHLHDSLVNDLIARLPLNGIGVPDAAIDRWFRALAGGGGLNELSRGGDPVGPQLATIQFDRDRPIRLRFQEQRFELILRLGFTPIAGPSIPTQEITIPFIVEVAGDAILFRPGEVGIAPGDPTAAGGVLDEAARQLIREQVQNRLQARSAPRRIPIKLPDAPPTAVTIGRVSFHRGWLSIAVD